MPFAIRSAMEEREAIVDKGDDEDDVVNQMANDMVRDALNEKPETSRGAELRKETLQVLSGAVVSPFQDKTGYDYTKLRTDTTVKALRDTFAILGKYPDLIPSIDEGDQSTISAAYDDCSLEIFRHLNGNGVRLEDYQYYFSVIKGVVNALEDVLLQQVQGHRTEIFSRLLSAKNPGNGKYDSNFATYEDLVRLLTNVRKETGDDMSDYFTIRKD